MALLSYYKNYIKAACIVNYNKRPESKSEIELVQNYCNKYKIKLEIKEINPEDYNNHSDNFQSWARKIRYDFFYEIAKKYNANSILIGHHFDDFLETAYMQKFNKNSKALFYGIKKKSFWKDIEIYRPFIFLFRKKTLERMCIERSVPYVIDSSNFSDEFERNRVRKIISSWTSEQVFQFKKEIFNYNKKNKKLYKTTSKQFNEFKKLNFEVSFVLNLTFDEKYYLIYNYLNFINELNKSEKKINAIIQFIDSLSVKSYRLEANKSLIIKNNCLMVLEDENIK